MRYHTSKPCISLGQPATPLMARTSLLLNCSGERENETPTEQAEMSRKHKTRNAEKTNKKRRRRRRGGRERERESTNEHNRTTRQQQDNNNERIEERNNDTEST
jgi:hypothetical protein